MTEIRTNQSELHWQTHFLLAEKLGVWVKGRRVTANTLFPSKLPLLVACVCMC